MLPGLSAVQKYPPKHLVHKNHVWLSCSIYRDSVWIWLGYTFLAASVPQVSNRASGYVGVHVRGGSENSTRKGGRADCHFMWSKSSTVSSVKLQLPSIVMSVEVSPVHQTVQLRQRFKKGAIIGLANVAWDGTSCANCLPSVLQESPSLKILDVTFRRM